MAGGVLLFWSGNIPQVERFNFEVGKTTWSFNRISANLMQPPILCRENNLQEVLYAKLTFTSNTRSLEQHLYFASGRTETSSHLNVCHFFERDQDFSEDRSLEMHCELTAYSVHDFSMVPVESVVEKIKLQTNCPILMKKVEKFESLSSDIRALLESGDFSDAVLCCSSKEIKVHKTILCARSPVFAGMFRNAMKENIENRVEITDIEEAVLMKMLSYIYTGIIEDCDFSLLSDLYAAAEKYDIVELKSTTRLFLKNKITIDTVIDMLVFADIYSDNDLKLFCVKFITENFQRLRTSHHWEVFLKEHLILGLETMHTLLNTLLPLNEA